MTGGAGRRIAILGSRGIPARYGGFETFAEELSAGLAERGFRVTVFCERESGETPPREHRGVRLVHVRALPAGPLRTVLYDLACLARSLRGYDAVYMLGYGIAWAFGLPRLFGTPLFVNMDGVEWWRAKWSPFARLYLRSMEGAAVRLAHGVFADAEGIRDHLESRHGEMRRAWTIAYGAELVEDADEAKLLPLGVRAGEYHLVVCRIEPENHVLEIVRGYRASGCRRPLLVVGNADGTAYSAAVRAAAAEGEDAAGRVLFPGAVYDGGALTALRFHCRTYIHGHSVGGTNPSLLEALACGNEVIAHDNPFNREVLGGGADYFAGEAALSACLSRTEGTPLAPERREVAWRIVRERYTWPQIVEQYASVFADQGA
ncbi:MAG: DUF1972 domain-containing protein [Gemmatimonadota bacterium]|nr:DUF1972 domain-containing protein [Gemmatimonadota bacterium]